MTDDAKPLDQKRSRRQERKKELLDRVNEELIKLVLAGQTINHDLVADRVGVSRRTLYRYFPDRDSLLESVWLRTAELGAGDLEMPETVADLVDTLPRLHAGFDRLADLMILGHTTPQGRLMRHATNKQRLRKYRAAAAEAVRSLPRADAELATAMLQTLHVAPWLEMHEYWGLDGGQIARAIGWAMRALLDDLQRRGSLPLDRSLPDPGARPGTSEQEAPAPVRRAAVLQG